MGFARSAFAASAVLAAFVATGTAGGSRERARGAHVASVVHLYDSGSTNPQELYPPLPWFLPDGDVMAYDGVRISPDGAKTVVAIPDGAYAGAGVGCLDAEGNRWLIATQDAASRLVRIAPDGGVTSVPIDAGATDPSFLGIEAMAVRHGFVHVLTIRFAADGAAWLQRFLLDGTPDSPALRVTPPEEPYYDAARLDVDAQGSAYLLWQAGPLDPGADAPGYALDWRRVDADGSMSAVVRLFTSPWGPFSFWDSRKGPDDTIWVMPLFDGSTDARGPIGVRRDGVVLPVIDLHAEYDGRTHTFGMSTFGVDAAGEVRTLLLRGGYVGSAEPLSHWRPMWQRFGADATPLRSRRLVEPSRPRRRIGRSGIWFQQMEVAPDGSSLIAVIRRKGPDYRGASAPGVLEFLHLGPDGRVLSTDSVPAAFHVSYARIASTLVGDRPRFAVTWSQRTTADGPLAAFLTILE